MRAMRAMRVVTKLKHDARGASLVECALIIALIALIAVLALPMMGVKVKETSCNAISGLDGDRAWWEEGKCYTEDGDDDFADILF